MEVLGKIGTIVVISLVFGLLLAWPASLLWNSCLVPAISGLHEVGIFQMWGINILASIVFKGVEVST